MKTPTHRRSLGGLAFAAIALACSYDPHPDDGKQQCYGTARECPDGYVCQADRRCWSKGQGPSVTPGTGGTVGVGGAPSTGGIVGGSGGRLGSGGRPGTGGGLGQGGVGNTGGVVGHGGTLGVGGVIGHGGTLGVGGVIGHGGTLGVGGTIGLGGSISLGGSIGHGGSISLGGSIASGGSISLGGSLGHGGVIGTGGVIPMGGVTGAGGTGTPPNAGTTMTISNYQAHGAMTGFGWIALGSLDTVTDPTCNSPVGPIAADVTCDYTAWSSPTAYCMTGSLPAVTSSTEYPQNWGIQLGINATPTPGGTLGQSFSALALSTTGTPSDGLRAVVHRKGDLPDASYCAFITPGVSVPFASFNSSCWDNQGKPLAAADVANLDQVCLQVTSGDTAITVKDLCLTGITFTR